MTCNKSSIESAWYAAYVQYDVWLSNANIADMNALFDAGSGVGALYEALLRWGVIEAHTPPGVGAAIAGILWIEKSLINWYADGCGVHITVYDVTVPPVSFHEMESQ